MSEHVATHDLKLTPGVTVRLAPEQTLISIVAPEKERAKDIAAALGNHDAVQLETTSATLQHAAQGRQFNGTVYVATPQLLGAFGIKSS